MQADDRTTQLLRPSHKWGARTALVNVLTGFLLLAAATFASIPISTAMAQPGKPIRIVAFGDSLSAGYGLRPSQSFPAQLQKALKARGHNVVVDNAGVSGDTTRRRPRPHRLGHRR